MGYLAVALLFISFLVWMSRVLYSIWWKPMKLERLLKEQGIVGLPYKLFYGNLDENDALNKEARSKPMNLSHKIAARVAPILHHTVEKYGKLSVIWYGNHPRVTVFDPEMVKEILSNKFGHFEKIKLNPLLKLLATGLAQHEGEKWARHRRIINPAFHLEKIKLMLPAFSASCVALIDKWEKLMDPHGYSCEVDVWPDLQHLTGDVISRTAFGSSYKEGNRIFKLQSEQALLMIQAASSVYFPGLELLPTKKNLRRREIDREVRALLTGMIKKKEKAIKLGEAAPDDLLGLLIKSNLKECQEGGNSKGMTIEDVIAECKLFYFAGQETTSVLLNWTMIALSMNSDWQTRAREEVLQIFGKNKPDFDGLSHLKIVNMILHEILRLYPPVVALIRSTYKEMTIGGVTFPAEVEICLPTVLVHHDKEIWGEDAEEFNPERFARGVSNATKYQTAFFPFGWGPRICIGQTFALTEAKLAMAMILQNFWFELSPTYVHAPFPIVTIQPQYGSQIILHKL
ncbi:cytochrome P450 CYP72A616-like [Aristolochia californica]|uniref:cytochrome P450 CYP72A616-like n=1 Tax=Aristolochia californica TaxID=171875 RepID=UPI0035DF51AD